MTRGEEHVARPPFRFWMTGCMAVVMSAFVGNTAARAERGATCHSSRYSVAETVQRIEASAQRHGLQMFALVERRPAGSDNGGEASNWKVVVLASSAGGTLVLMDRPGGQHAVPLSLVVRANPGGGSEVLMGSSIAGASFEGLPGPVQRELAELPGLVAEALETDA